MACDGLGCSHTDRWRGWGSIVAAQQEDEEEEEEDEVGTRMVKDEAAHCPGRCLILDMLWDAE